MDNRFYGDSRIGLDALLENRDFKHKILVTNDYNDLVVVQTAEKNGISIIPKPLVTIWPIKHVKPWNLVQSANESS